MDRRRFLRSVGASAFPLAAGCQKEPQHGDGIEFENPSFEDGLEGWVPGRDVPTDPNTGDPVATRIEASNERASDGSRSVALFIDGRQDDGTIWVQQQADLTDVAELTVDVYSPEESFNTITKVAAYAGLNPKKPLTESDFNTEHAVEDHGGWKTYQYPVKHDGTGLIAVGISVVWETEVTRWIDNVQLGKPV